MAGRRKHRSTAAVKYQREKKAKPKVEYDKSLAEDMLLASIYYQNPVTHASPNGTCHLCGKKVTGERKLCGLCAAKKERRTEWS